MTTITKTEKRINSLTTRANYCLDAYAKLFAETKADDVNKAVYEDAKTYAQKARTELKRKTQDLATAEKASSFAVKALYKLTMASDDWFAKYCKENSIDPLKFARNTHGKAEAFVHYVLTGQTKKPGKKAFYQAENIDHFLAFQLKGAKSLHSVPADYDLYETDVKISIQDIARRLGKPDDFGVCRPVDTRSQPKYVINALVLLGWATYDGTGTAGMLTIKADSPLIERINQQSSQYNSDNA